MKLNDLKNYCLSLALTPFLVGNSVHADDTLAALMQRMKSDTAVRVAYQETRTLALMEQPWHGSGYMYSLPPDLMIKEQLRPERVLMGINGEQMLYFDPGNEVRHQGVMDADNPMTLNIAVFKALMTADQALLDSLYQVEFVSLPERWSMVLRAKNDPDSPFRIEISGAHGKQAERIHVEQADGDSREISMEKEAEGGEVKARMEQLYQELLGADE
ncbi:outer membrane lipoprotein carrier protein LolA [Methylomarinum sp. Ch1-1]|uniref:Outer membrane lipoprotein carrier protein LolA n=1 Tax=Methylomarinum roseum TaxID=3067653 RepID=A0AAU7NXB4_9GAMM|nr:outer membrane lipoprotein carrier protein LolA [Methylomarinum sp. Ch1-1]MDP4522311.1 outer membrane lipoprotein carrier protein LolA [Methylomarinum sp. Ch1-1]